jgi:hypothetical protein
VAVKFNVDPEHTGPLFAAATVGSELIVTAVVFVPLHPLESVRMTV